MDAVTTTEHPPVTASSDGGAEQCGGETIPSHPIPSALGCTQAGRTRLTVLLISSHGELTRLRVRRGWVEGTVFPDDGGYSGLLAYDLEPMCFFVPPLPSHWQELLTTRLQLITVDSGSVLAVQVR